MSLQTWYSAAQAILFPTVVRNGLTVSCVQLRKLYWHTPAQKLVGIFCNALTNYNLGDSFGLSWRLQYLWRDGTPVDVTTPVNAVESNELPVTHTTDGRVVRRGVLGIDVSDLELQNAAGDGVFALSTQWAHDILAHPSLGSAENVLPNMQASVLRPSDGIGWRVSDVTGRLIIVEQPGGITRLSATNPTLFGAVRDFLWIDNGTVALTTVTDNDSPARIHIISAQGDEWSLKWSAELPNTDQVTAWDGANKILYSCGRYVSNAVIHASWLRRAATSMSVLTLRAGTELVELAPSLISVLVTDSLDCGVCQATVGWTLTPQASGGVLVSAYSLTNNSGVATITYLGPVLDAANITETVCAVTTTIDPVTRVR